MDIKRVSVRTFVGGTPEQTARKVCEESMEFYAEHALYQTYWNDHDPDGEDIAMMRMKMELGDVITACFNYADMVGIDLQECVDLAETKNISNGRYDRMYV